MQLSEHPSEAPMHLQCGCSKEISSQACEEKHLVLLAAEVLTNNSLGNILLLFHFKKTKQKAQGDTKLTSPCRYNNFPPSIIHVSLSMTTATMHSSEEISSGSLGKYTVLAEPRRSGLSDSEYHRYLFLYWSVRSFACGLCLCVLHGNCVLVWQHQEQGVSWLLELLRPGSQKLMLSLWAAPGTNDNSNSLQMKKSFL